MGKMGPMGLMGQGADKPVRTTLKEPGGRNDEVYELSQIRKEVKNLANEAKNIE